MNYSKIMSSLFATLYNPASVKIYSANPQQYLTESGFNADEQTLFINLIQPLQQLLQQALLQQQQNEIKLVNDSFLKALVQTNTQTTKGFNTTMIMYQVSFYLGIVLIIAALIFAIVTRSPLFAILFGSIGTLDILTFFIAKPPKDLQDSRADQAKLNAIFYSWFTDLYNWNSYYLQYSSKGENIELAIMTDVSKTQIENTERLMKIISEHIS
ncbi:MAG: hypothetical protein ACR2FN_04145 [Chitinophagaceae bacterium]